MPRIDKFKNLLRKGERSFLANYESSINNLIDDLSKDGLLKSYFSEDQVKRIQKFIISSNSAAHLFSNANKIITLDKEKNKENIKKLKEMGLRVNTIGNQYGTIMCHMYQVTAERLKLHLITCIEFSLLGISEVDKKSLGPIIKKLKDKYPNNKFIQYLDTKIRNAVTHYTYFFENGKLKLCNGYFDPNPEEMEIHNFIIESKRMNILTEAFFIIFLDKHNPGEDLRMDI